MGSRNLVFYTNNIISIDSKETITGRSMKTGDHSTAMTGKEHVTREHTCQYDFCYLLFLKSNNVTIIESRIGVARIIHPPITERWLFTTSMTLLNLILTFYPSLPYIQMSQLSTQYPRVRIHIYWRVSLSKLLCRSVVVSTRWLCYDTEEGKRGGGQVIVCVCVYEYICVYTCG